MTDDERGDTPEVGVGRRVRLLRLARGWTQAELSDRLCAAGWDIDPTGVTRLERGARAIQVRQLYVLAGVLEALPEELLPESALSISKVAGEVVASLSEGRHHLVRALGKLDRLQSTLTGQGGEALGIATGLPNDLDALIALMLQRLGEPDPIELWDMDEEAVQARAQRYRRLLEAVTNGLVTTGSW